MLGNIPSRFNNLVIFVVSKIFRRELGNFSQTTFVNLASYFLGKYFDYMSCDIFNYTLGKLRNFRVISWQTFFRKISKKIFKVYKKRSYILSLALNIFHGR